MKASVAWCQILANGHTPVLRMYDSNGANLVFNQNYEH